MSITEQQVNDAFESALNLSEMAGKNEWPVFQEILEGQADKAWEEFYALQDAFVADPANVSLFADSDDD